MLIDGLDVLSIWNDDDVDDDSLSQSNAIAAFTAAAVAMTIN